MSINSIKQLLCSFPPHGPAVCVKSPHKAKATTFELLVSAIAATAESRKRLLNTALRNIRIGRRRAAVTVVSPHMNAVV